jgi:hypothetical protein
LKYLSNYALVFQVVFFLQGFRGKVCEHFTVLIACYEHNTYSYKMYLTIMFHKVIIIITKPLNFLHLPVTTKESLQHPSLNTLKH